MKIGLIGLGKMGFNLGLNMMDHGHKVVAFDLNNQAVQEFAASGGSAANSVQNVLEQLDKPRVLFLMVPQGAPVDALIKELKPHLQASDILVDAGNSNYKDSLRRAADLKGHGVHFMDCGTSGGMEGARHGACYMIGGDQGAFEVIEPLLRDTSVSGGYFYTGESGSGHFAKMVHNGIEYGMMAAIGEGFDLLDKSRFSYDYEQLARVWSNGSVIRGWLMELAQKAFANDPKLDAIKGVMHSSGEGKWTVEEALDVELATPVIALSLMMRYRSQETDTFTGKVVAALRNEFGGHAVEKA
ncbi:decarboxylating 6-phosphogluconate dehydrogenase [Alicyclobacillus tolerans]|uniref:phosphogluconate dehydrogenase (NAD(+)-dependent, decarboxylating) n=1 Tax=Alicyclobacillus tolerans TaxID=90970 RepID=UPI001EFFC33D|nr:decarboxylating 6-phosphogluconate dehydrogenase [Alicyclobacillus tolerans]MCF8564019.1 decarboxylating 6-phosphogluconate dehydrogenase [Alicyclobacillus tolerans]